MSNAEDPLLHHLRSYSLLDALKHRRSRRFARGMQTERGPLRFNSTQQPRPLTEQEVACMAFAACGVTGHALGDLVYADGEGGTMMAGFLGRTVSSADAVQSVSVAVVDERGSYLLKRPEHFSGAEYKQLLELSRQDKHEELYRASRVLISEKKCVPPNQMPFSIDCNHWDLYAPGTTYFLPISDYSYMYINGLLEFLNETMAVFVVDERASFAPAGLKRFAKSRGGHLRDDPHAGHTLTIERLESLLRSVVSVEQGMILQNLSLMAQAIGLGGFPNFAAHEFAWFEALGFRRRRCNTLRYLGASKLKSKIASWLGKNPSLEFPVGLEVGGEVLLGAYCPPYYASMRDAVLAVVDRKFGARGIFTEKIGVSAFLDPKSVGRSSSKISERVIEATIAYCEYIYSKYGQFPAYSAPFRTGVGFQASHLDLDFYRTHYKPEALSETQLKHEARNRQ